MEEHHKLIAKIQHFYDVMKQRLDFADDYAITNLADKSKHASEELRSLTDEYSRVFEAFLYIENA